MLSIFSGEVEFGDNRTPPASLRALASALALTEVVNKDGTFAYFYSKRLPSNTNNYLSTEQRSASQNA